MENNNTAMQNGNGLRESSRNSDVIQRLQAEVSKLESQLSRIEVKDGPHRFSLMKTYRSMIESRVELLSQMGV